MSLSIEIEATDGAARAGRVTTGRGSFPTPVFMPVGTRAAVKTLDSNDLDALAPPIVLANTYHLMERPGSDLIAEVGGLHRFMSWDGHVLTDSGGYQIFSLTPKITEQGATFSSVYDGSKVELTPERSVAVQQDLGSDIAMVLDVCPALPATREHLVEVMELTLRWAERSRAAHDRADQAQFGIVQGGVEPDLRAESARHTVEIGFDGYAVGGLSVGEPHEQMKTILEMTCPLLPAAKPRYLMGVGTPRDIVMAVATGIDMFDCVMPTRNGRNGVAFTSRGPVRLKNLVHKTDSAPLDSACDCYTCRHFSRGYLRHLFLAEEMLGPILASIHNLRFFQGFMGQMRDAIARGTLSEIEEAFPITGTDARLAGDA